jgi:hypothetical protein
MNKLLLPLFAASLGSSAWAGEMRPLLPTYFPETGQTLVSTGISTSAGTASYESFGSGITAQPFAKTRTSATFASMQYGVTDSLRVGFGQSFILDASFMPVSPSYRTTGWTNPTFMATKNLSTTSSEITSVNFSFSPKTGNVPLNRNQVAAISAFYAAKLNNEWWSSLSATYSVRPASAPEAFALTAAVAKDFGKYSGQLSLRAARTADSHQNSISRSERSTEPTVNASLSGAISEKQDWIANYSYGAGRSVERLDSGAGYVDGKWRSRSLSLSLLTRF